ncbi:hypothetical protein M9458_050287, partial [Cirrhinus mrigala]
RWTRNPLGSPRAGSNPADYGRAFTPLALAFCDDNCGFQGLWPSLSLPCLLAASVP